MKSVSIIAMSDCVHDRRVRQIAGSLGEAGFQTQVIALGSGEQRAQEIYQQYVISRIFLSTRIWPKGLVFQGAKYLEYLVRALLAVRQSDVVHCCDLPTLPIGVLFRLIRYRYRPLVVYDAHEHETEVHWVTGLRKLVTKKLERFCIPFADATITVSDSIACDYVRLYGIAKPLVVLNAPPFSLPARDNALRASLGISEGSNVFLYQGVVSTGRGLEFAASYFRDHPETGILLILGNGSLKEDLIAKYRDAANIKFHSAVAVDELHGFTSSADYGLVLIENNCLSHYYCLPTKLFECIMAGIPVIVSNVPEMRRVVEEFDVGAVLESFDSHALGMAVHNALQSTTSDRVAALEAAARRFCWEVESIKLITLYKSLT